MSTTIIKRIHWLNLIIVIVGAAAATALLRGFFGLGVWTAQFIVCLLGFISVAIVPILKDKP